MKETKHNWPTVNRGDGRVELICPHGVGHPSEVLSPGPWEDWMGVHGCDGCCTTPEYFAAERRAHGRE